jgi:hypothetical protein
MRSIQLLLFTTGFALSCSVSAECGIVDDAIRHDASAQKKAQTTLPKPSSAQEALRAVLRSQVVQSTTKDVVEKSGDASTTDR